MLKLAQLDKVMVWGAGNSAKVAPDLTGIMPRYMGASLRNWISVTSLNPRGVSRDLDGRLVLDMHAVSSFTNMSAGAELWSVMAPGSYINSLNAIDNGYMSLRGTSMAAPQVSGTLALVQQAFPWMTGKQLADAVLSTANNTFTAPSHIVLAGDNLLFVKIDDSGQAWTPQAAELTKLMTDAYNKDPENFWNIGLDYYLEGVANNFYNTIVMTREQVFGQGILDAGKAVRGIARLDANRLDKNDVWDLGAELGGQPAKYALETFDTKGWAAEFSNDIIQRLWDNKYHHPDFQTTASGPTADNADALALQGLDVGLRKTGQGLLILSGTNTYKGATVAEGGVLAVSRRPDGSGGVLEHSDVLVRGQGAMAGDGEIKGKVVNASMVLPGMGFMGLQGGHVLTVGDYTQKPGAALGITFDATGTHTQLATTTALIDGGSLLFHPTAGFYGETSLNLDAVLTGSVAGAFDSILVNSPSPTLGFSLSGGHAGAVITQQRAPDAYSRYANNDGGASAGRMLTGVAREAQGDMQKLLMALDFSNSDGSDVRAGLNQLGTESYDLTTRAALEAQRGMNVRMVRRLLDQVHAQPPTKGAEQGVSAAQNAQDVQDGDDRASVSSGWQAFVMPYAAHMHQADGCGSAGYTSFGTGVDMGLERRFDSGLTAGLSLALEHRRARFHGDLDAQAQSLDVYVGAHALLAPRPWDGFYLMGLARLGLDDNNLTRNINFNGYVRQNESHWTAPAGGALLGGGKDWTFSLDDTEESRFFAGPLAWLEYGFVARPEISESNGGASRLRVDAGYYDSLSLAMGGRTGFSRPLGVKTGEKHGTLTVDVLAAWRHELTGGDMRTSAAFDGYSSHGFESATRRVGRDALLVQGGLKATHASGFFMQADVGTEIFHLRTASFNGGLRVGWEF